MIADLKQEQFTHCRCFNCKHLGKMESFNPVIVALEDSNHPFIKISLDGNNKGVLQTVNFNCPICNSANVEALYANEVN